MPNKKGVHVDKYQHIFLLYPQDALDFGEGEGERLVWVETEDRRMFKYVRTNLQWPSTPHVTLTSPGVGKRIPLGPIPILEDEVGFRSMVGWYFINIFITFPTVSVGGLQMCCQSYQFIHNMKTVNSGLIVCVLCISIIFQNACHREKIKQFVRTSQSNDDFRTDYAYMYIEFAVFVSSYIFSSCAIFSSVNSTA